MNFRIVAGHIMLWGAIVGPFLMLQGSEFSNGRDNNADVLFVLTAVWIFSAIYLVIARKLLCKSEKDRISHEVKILNLKLERAKLKKEFKSIQSNLNSR